MACQTRHGPSSAIKVCKDTLGIDLGQQDWHLLRKTVEFKTGEKLSREVIPSDEAATVAGDYYDAMCAHAGMPVDAAARDAFVTDFTSERVTAGTLHVMEEIAENGLPPEVTDRPRRGGKKVTAFKPSEKAEEPTPVPDNSDAMLDNNGVMRLRADKPVGPMGATQSEDVLAAGRVTDALLDPNSIVDSNFTPEEGVEAALIARSASDQMRANVDAIGADLAQRLSDNGIRSLHDDFTGTEMTPHSGWRYRSWDHAGVQEGLADSLAIRHDVSSQQAADLLSAYGEFASVDGYRSGGLREHGLRAGDFAEGVAGDRTLMVQYADRDERIAPPQAVLGVISHRDAIDSMVATTADARARIADMPLEDAVREYAAVRRVERAMSKIASGVETDVATRMMDEGLVDGVAGYKARTTSGGEKWDAEELDRKVIPLAAEKAGVDPRVAHEVIADFKEVARVSRYKVKGLKAVDIDADEYRHKTPGSRKLAPVE